MAHHYQRTTRDSLQGKEGTNEHREVSKFVVPIFHGCQGQPFHSADVRDLGKVPCYEMLYIVPMADGYMVPEQSANVTICIWQMFGGHSLCSNSFLVHLTSSNRRHLAFLANTCNHLSIYHPSQTTKLHFKCASLHSQFDPRRISDIYLLQLDACTYYTTYVVG